jgi:hypothetical protein
MSESGPHKERRSAPRFVTRNALLHYKKKAILGILGGGGSQRPLPIRNISSKGVCFLCDEKLKPGQAIEVSMTLKPGGQKVKVPLKVVWCGEGKGIYEHAAGGMFLEYPMELRPIMAQIEKYVELRDKDESETQMLKRFPK